MSQIKSNYNDFDKLLSAKYMELKTKIETNRLEIIQSIPEPQVVEMPDMRLYARANLVTQLDDQVN